jgi:hypothetical protein
VVFILVAVLVPIGLQDPLLNSDGDLARHLSHGRYILAHGGLITTDPFSFTRPGAPFLGFEYGSQIILAAVERFGGLPAVAVLAGLLLATTYALLAKFMLRRGVDPLLAYLATTIGAALGAGHWVARPHLFSLLLSLLLLEMLESPRARPLWQYVLFFALWANIHGGFVFGLILIGVYLAGALAEWVTTGPTSEFKPRARHYAGALAASLLGTVLNPHGLELHQHVLAFFGQRYLLDNTAEFTSPDFHDIVGKMFLIGLLLSVVSLILIQKRPRFPRLFAVCAMIAFGLNAVRNVALFGLIAIPLVALEVNEAWQRLPDPRGIRGRFGQTAQRTSTLPWCLALTILLVALAGSRGRLGSTQLIRDGFNPETFPVAAVAKGRQAGLQGHLFSEFAWGGYLVYAWPEQRIFIDGGTDFFGPELFKEFADIKQLRPGWRKLLQKWDVSLALLRRHTTLSHELSRDPRWQLWYCDSLSVLLRRSDAPGSALSPAAADSAESRLDACWLRPRRDSHE